MLTIEFEPPVFDRCACCDGQNTRLTRFVQRNGDAYAIYYAAFSDQHPTRHVHLLISIGDWAEDALTSARTAFYLRIRATKDQFEVTVCDAAESPWDRLGFYGRTLDREEALAHPMVRDVFHITDHIVAEDAPVIEYLSHAPPSA
jgi:hypothetical protein